MMRKIIITIIMALLFVGSVSAFITYPWGDYDFYDTSSIYNTVNLTTNNLSVKNAPESINLDNTFMVFWNGTHSVSREINYTNFPYLSVSGNTVSNTFTLNGNTISDWPVDTNETTRVNNIASSSCSIGDFVSSFSSDGTPVCTTPSSGSGEAFEEITSSCNSNLTGVPRYNYTSFEFQICNSTNWVTI